MKGLEVETPRPPSTCSPRLYRSDAARTDDLRRARNIQDQQKRRVALKKFLATKKAQEHRRVREEWAERTVDLDMRRDERIRRRKQEARAKEEAERKRNESNDTLNKLSEHGRDVLNSRIIPVSPSASAADKRDTAKFVGSPGRSASICRVR